MALCFVFVLSFLEVIMRKRQKLSKSYSKKSFKKGVKSHHKNRSIQPMRGGIRF